jgi:DnaJ-class molecular chaperone
MVAVVVLIGAIAAGGAAFTASNTLPTTDVAGYGSVTVTGATVSSIHNVVDSSGNITQVNLVFSDSQAGNTVKAGFADETALDTCSDTGTHTDWTCPVGNGTGTSGVEPISGAASYAVSVTQ